MRVFLDYQAIAPFLAWLAFTVSGFLLGYAISGNIQVSCFTGAVGGVIGYAVGRIKKRPKVRITGMSKLAITSQEASGSSGVYLCLAGLPEETIGRFADSVIENDYRMTARATSGILTRVQWEALCNEFIKRGLLIHKGRDARSGRVFTPAGRAAIRYLATKYSYTTLPEGDWRPIPEIQSGATHTRHNTHEGG